MKKVTSWSGGAGVGLLVHGGAGAVPAPRLMDHERGCLRAAEQGMAVLAQHGSALDAVVAAVRVMEDDPCFNAGTGACLNREGGLELDASVMEGTELRAGAVCALSPHKNPILIARAVLAADEHVLYAGAGADAFAKAHGFDAVDPETMITASAREKLAQALAMGAAQSWAGGTVGAVARDARGAVAAATSTGGTAGKRIGRVGDTPLIGCGTYADDGAGAASATGHGEGIIRVVLARDAVAHMSSGASSELAARRAIENLSARVGSTAGLILIDAEGRLGWARSTETMTWGAAWLGADPQCGH